MAIARWMAELIEREADSWLGRPAPDHPDVIEAARRLRAWPVYRDIGGTPLIDGEGEVYCLEHATMTIGPEPDPYWRTVAWIAAAETVPELRAGLPARPADAIDCSDCGGLGRVRHWDGLLGCGRCRGLGWHGPT